MPASCSFLFRSWQFHAINSYISLVLLLVFEACLLDLNFHQALYEKLYLIVKFTYQQHLVYRLVIDCNGSFICLCLPSLIAGLLLLSIIKSSEIDYPKQFLIVYYHDPNLVELLIVDLV